MTHRRSKRAPCKLSIHQPTKQARCFDMRRIDRQPHIDHRQSAFQFTRAVLKNIGAEDRSREMTAFKRERAAIGLNGLFAA